MWIKFENGDEEAFTSAVHFSAIPSIPLFLRAIMTSELWSCFDCWYFGRQKMYSAGLTLRGTVITISISQPLD